MPDGEEFRSLGEDGSYKYLGVLETDQIKHEEMKGEIEAEFFSRVRKVLKSKLNAGNTIKAINTWSVSLVRYVAGIIEWNKEELQRMDRKTRKLLTMHGGFHPRSDVDRLYVPKDKGGRGLMAIEETVRYMEQSLYKYVDGKVDDIMRTVKPYMKERRDVTTKGKKPARGMAREGNAWANICKTGR